MAPASKRNPSRSCRLHPYMAGPQPTFAAARSQRSINQLGTIPAEIFDHIASNLDPVSLTNLSNTCNIFRRQRLSTHLNNFIWYKSLQGKAPTLPSTPQAVPVRSLGEPYQAALDYQQEIFQLLSDRRRCTVCFCHEDTMGSHVRIRLWKKALCRSCFEEESVSVQSLITDGFPTEIIGAYDGRVRLLGRRIMFKRQNFDAYLHRTTGRGLEESIRVFRGVGDT